MSELVTIILACMATASSAYAFYLSMKLKNSETALVTLKIENSRLKDIVLPKQQPVLLKQEIKK